MKRLPLYVSLLVASIWSAPVEAQLFGRKTKTNAVQRVPELIVAAKSDSDERKRAAAAAELREFDARTYPEIVSVLADVAKTDQRPSVREEAIDSLARIRPVSQLAGQTLEWSAAHDDSWKVRWQAKSALVRYNWAGYSAKGNSAATGGAGTVTTQEPPLLNDPHVNAPHVQTPPAAPPQRMQTPRSPASVPAPPAVKEEARTQGPFSRLLSGKKNAAPTSVSLPPPPLPTGPAPAAPVAAAPVAAAPVAAAPDAPPVIDEPGQPTLETPPPIVVEVPATPQGTPAPPTAPPTAPPAGTAKSAAPRSNLVEPNFRPAGQGTPRPGFSTAQPLPQSIVPSNPPRTAAPPISTPPSAEPGPALTPPM